MESDRLIFVCDEEPLVLSSEHGFGHNPLQLGKVLRTKSNYGLTIVRKLGWSRNSSVWLARAPSRDTYGSKFIAVKVLTTSCTSESLRGHQYEREILELIRSENPGHRGFQYCLQLIDSLTCTSRQGLHTCLVTGVLGHSIFDNSAKKKGSRGALPTSLVKRVIRQTLLALEYLHDECGIVHTCIRPENMLIRIQDVEATVEESLQTSPSEAYPIRIEKALSNEPIITVKSQPIPSDELRWDRVDICIADFGQARFLGDTVKIPHEQRDTLLAPEMLLKHPWSAAVDIWSVGCLVFEYLTGADFFQLQDNFNTPREWVHIRRMVEHIGPFPPTFLNQCHRAGEFFDKQGHLLRRCGPVLTYPIEQCLLAYDVLSDEDVISTSSFIRRCLTIVPTARPTASNLLADSWFSSK